MVQGMFVEFHALSNLRTAPRFPDKKSQSNHVDACHHRLCLSKARDEDGAHPSLADALERVPPPGPGSAQDALRARWVERAALPAHAGILSPGDAWTKPVFVSWMAFGDAAHPGHALAAVSYAPIAGREAVDRNAAMSVSQAVAAAAGAAA